MEKYCKSCGAVFNDLKFKLCPYCGGELDTRYGRQPIPRKLRHEVFKRDGYRCRECGSSKDETSLEIDHIVPVAKGGTNDIDNLQTLCRECNQKKHTDEWVGGKKDIKIAQNELKNLEEQLKKYEVKLEHAKTEDEKIEYQYMIIKLNEKISDVLHSIKKLEITEKKRIKQEKKKVKKEKLFKKYYVQSDDDFIKFLSKYFNMEEKNKNDIINCLVNNYSEERISNLEMKNKLLKKCCVQLDDEYIKFLSTYFKMEDRNKWDIIYYLVNNYSEGQIFNIKKTTNSWCKCPKCGCDIHSTFIECWNCGKKLFNDGDMVNYPTFLKYNEILNKHNIK